MRWTPTVVAGLLGWALLAGAPGDARADNAHPEVTAEAEPDHAATSDHDAAGGHGQPNILEPQIPLAVWTLVVFLLLLLVLGKYAWGPLAKALHEREHALEAAVASSERARNEAEALLAQHRQLMDQAHQQAQAILDEARRAAQANAEELRRAAQAEADATHQRALRDIESARDQALTEIWSKAAELAVHTAGKILGRELGADDHRRLIEAAAAELPPGPNGHGGRAA